MAAAADGNNDEVGQKDLEDDDLNRPMQVPRQPFLRLSASGIAY